MNLDLDPNFHQKGDENPKNMSTLLHDFCLMFLKCLFKLLKLTFQGLKAVKKSIFKFLLKTESVSGSELAKY